MPASLPIVYPATRHDVAEKERARGDTNHLVRDVSNRRKGAGSVPGRCARSDDRHPCSSWKDLTSIRIV